MAKMNFGWIITAKVNNDLEYMYRYDVAPNSDDTRELLEPALDEFWHDDLPDCPASEDIVSLNCKLAEDSGLVLYEQNIKFNPAIFRHYFDLGWSASSKEPNERYTLEQFFEDLDSDTED